MPTLDFVFFDAGGGHRSAATALKQECDRQGLPWEIRLMDLREILDEIDIFRKLTGLSLEDIYNTMLKKGWTLGSAQLVPVMHMAIRLFHGQQVKLLRRHWSQTRPDMVVSLVPNFNRAMRQALAEALPAVPYAGVLTDFADYPPHFWLERQEQYVICGTEKAVEQARQHGHPERRIFRTSGMILNPRFYEPVEVDRAAGRRRLGLDPELSTGLVLFGGQGSGVMLEIVRRLDETDLALQLILICGRNAKLAGSLRQMKTRIPLFVEEFTEEVPYYMHLSDFFIGKPGPGSISEAMAMHLPVIVERNAWTLPQERYNADWLIEHEAGIVLSSFRGIAPAVRQLLEPRNFARYRSSAAAIQNRALFEIPPILQHILESHGKGVL